MPVHQGGIAYTIGNRVDHEQGLALGEKGGDIAIAVGVPRVNQLEVAAIDFMGDTLVGKGFLSGQLATGLAPLRRILPVRKRLSG